MTTEEYDQLLEQMREIRARRDAAIAEATRQADLLEALWKRLDTEEHRLAQQALAHVPIASRKLVVGE